MTAIEALAPNAISAMSHALSRHRLVILCGTGVTAAATRGHSNSSWAGLIENGIQRSVDEGVRDIDWAARALGDVKSGILPDMIVAAEKVTAALQDKPGLYGAWLEDTIGSLECKDSTLPDELARLAGSGALIVTTNYDDILAEAAGLPVLTEADGTVELRKVVKRQKSAVVHLHGHWEKPATVVFGTGSYSRIADSVTVKTFMTTLLYADTMVFVGVGDGLSDPNFEGLRGWCALILGSSGDPHYRLARKADMATSASQHEASENINVVSYGADFSELAPFLASISAPVPTRGSQFPAPRPSARHAPTDKPLSNTTTEQELLSRSSLNARLENLLPLREALDSPPGSVRSGLEALAAFEDVLRGPLDDLATLVTGDLAGEQLREANQFAQRLENLVELLGVSPDAVVVNNS
jgi:hypothetical protein